MKMCRICGIEDNEREMFSKQNYEIWYCEKCFKSLKKTREYLKLNCKTCKNYKTKIECKWRNKNTIQIITTEHICTESEKRKNVACNKYQEVLK